MKYSKAGILKKKVGPASDVLQEEAKRMEEKLSELKEFMQKEKEKRDSAPKMKDGSKWRSAVTSKPLTGYADLVLTQKSKMQTRTKPPSQQKKEEFLPSSLLGQVEEKALPSAPTHEVLDFLTSCGLEKYHQVFVDNGIEEMEILIELTEGHLANLNIPLGHRLKILKKLKDLKGKENTYKDPPAEESLKTVKKTTEMCVGDDSELPAGDFNEKDSSEMFREAIEQLRNSGSPTKHKVKSKNTEEALKKVRFLEPVTEEMLPKEIKGMLYEGTWEPEHSAVPETFEESSGTTASILIIERKSCWNCYKIFSADLIYKAYDKEFCCDGCAKKYFESRAVICECGKEFIKNDGFISKGQWVCSEECAQKLEVEAGINDKDETGMEEVKENNQDDEEINDENDENYDGFLGIDPVTGDPIFKNNE